MTKEYKVRYSTHWDINTPDEVSAVLETARQNNQRLHISFGYTEHDAEKDKEIGLDWLEESMGYGYIGRSSGTVKIPLLIHNSRSRGGPALLDDCIVRIRESKGGKVLWQHPDYHHGKITVHQKPIPVEYLPGGVLRVDVRRDGAVHAAFKDLPSALRWINKVGVTAEIASELESVA